MATDNVGNRLQNLDEALAVAHCCSIIDTIKVATGTYKPTKKPYNGCTEMTTADARDLTFHLPDGLVLWGGYPAGGGVRNSTTNITTLSGDFNGDDVVTGSGSTLSIIGNGENAYHVLIASAPAVAGIGVTIDGFSIVGGNASGSFNSYITINGNNIIRNSGGGIYTFSGTNNTITNNTLSGNSANDNGGGIYTQSGTNTITNNTLSGNTASNGGGGGIFTSGATNTQISNNTLSGNSANTYGGGIYTFGGTNTITNNTLSGNSASSGGGIYTYLGTNTITNNTLSGNSASSGGGIYTNGTGTNTLTNNIFWGNFQGTSSTVGGADYHAQGTNSNTLKNNILQLASSNYPLSNTGNYAIGTAASGNIFAQDPLFVDATDIDGADDIHRTADDGLRLQIGSPCINTGNNTGVTATDITGAVRIQNTTVDMGAYEGGVNVCPTVPTLYVDASIATSGNGQSWATAYKTLDEALAVEHCCSIIDTIKVATGTYLPTKKPYNGCTEMTTIDARDLTFHLPDGLVLWGGYPTGGGVRNIPANITTLSGDFNGDDVVAGSGSTLSITGNGENAYHVVLAAAATVGGIGVTIDGFSIVGGNASGSFNSYITINGNNIIRNSGGGMYINNGTNILTNNTLLGNSAGVGGGICTNGGANTLTNNTLLGNSAGGGGGGICINYGTNNTLTNNTLSDNSAGAGGGIYTYYGTNNTLINNTLSGNSANNGGGIYTYDNSNTLTNNTLSGNSAAYDGGGILTNNGVNTLTNNIFWDNKRGTNTTILGADYYAIGTNGNTFTNNLLQLAASNYTTVGTGNYDLGASASGNIFAQDPLFVDADNIDGADNIHRTADDGLRLVYGSPALNTGTTIGAPTTDILGTARPQGTGIDMGAYEGGVCPTVPTLYVDASIATSGNGQSWATAFKTLDEALAVAHCCSIIDTIKVATGTYIPTKKPYNGCTEMTTTFARDLTFHLPDGLVLWGGYPAGGGVRNIPTNITTLSGDFNGDDAVTGSGSTLSITGNTENAYHVVFASTTFSGLGITVDGFTIIGGNANGSGNISGIYRFHGGGIYTRDGTNTISNNTLSGNMASNGGGGIYTNGGTNTISNNTVSKNRASGEGGGGIYTFFGTNTLTNNTLSGNSVTFIADNG
ncbi:MAG: right-handed parallel beta-helix repeat-containing protein, partial [Sphingobacteriales bacterium]|nr:right-handed parallel beta-helix repeat-containing protein [Sphingobacteriales bacterium]